MGEEAQSNVLKLRSIVAKVVIIDDPVRYRHIA